MILKSIAKHSNFSSLFSYVGRYAAKNKSTKQGEATLILKKNLKSKTLEGFIQEYKFNDRLRVSKRKHSPKLFHEIIAFASQDKKAITEKLLQVVAKKYVTLRGVDNLYLIFWHKDREHQHLHCIVSGVTTTGRSARISKQAFQNIKIELEQFQDTFPELKFSKVNHGQKRLIERTVEQYTKARQTLKAKLLQTLKGVIQVTRKELLSCMNEKGYEPYYRNDKLQGFIVQGKKFRLTSLGLAKDEIELIGKNTIKKNNVVEMELENMRSLRQRGKSLER